MLAEHCHDGWGEIEIHLHHGVPEPDTAETLRRSLVAFRDALAFRQQCLALEEGRKFRRTFLCTAFLPEPILRVE